MDTASSPLTRAAQAQLPEHQRTCSGVCTVQLTPSGGTKLPNVATIVLAAEFYTESSPQGAEWQTVCLAAKKRAWMRLMLDSDEITGHQCSADRRGEVCLFDVQTDELVASVMTKSDEHSGGTQDGARQLLF